MEIYTNGNGYSENGNNLVLHPKHKENKNEAVTCGKSNSIPTLNENKILYTQSGKLNFHTQ